MSDLMRAVHEIRAHADAYTLAGKYYEGTVDELFCSPAVRRALRGALGGFDINLARRPVDAVLDRMKIAAVAVPGDEPATAFLRDKVWTPNRLGRYSKIVNRSALVHGDAYVIVWPGDADGSVSLFYNSPVTTRVFYQAENPRVKEFAAKVWSEGHGDQLIVRSNLYYVDRVERWTTKPGAKGDTDAEFFAYVEDGEPWPAPNPYGQVPVFHFKTGEPYGSPEHQGAFGPQNAITKLSSTLMSTVDFQAFPQRYALLGSAHADQGVDWDDDDPTAAPDADKSNLQAGPGKLWSLTADKVGEFSAANMDAFLKPMAVFVRLMAAATSTPLRFFDPQGVVPSGQALRADEAPLVARIEDREEWLGDEWGDSLTFAALVAGRPVPSVDVRWAPVQAADGPDDWKTVGLKLAAGVPFAQVMAEAGYPADVVAGWQVKEIGEAA